MDVRKMVAFITVAAAVAGCSILANPLVPKVLEGDSHADIAADYLATLCTLSPEDRAEIIPEVNAAIHPHSVELRCAGG